MAYVNSCLHCGTLLRTEAGNARQIRCPFHALSWSLDGKLKVLPDEWDFPQVDKDKFCLPEAQLGIWAGFVFVNFDADCEPFESYLENLPEHFAAFGLENRYKAAQALLIVYRFRPNGNDPDSYIIEIMFSGAIKRRALIWFSTFNRFVPSLISNSLASRPRGL